MGLLSKIFGADKAIEGVKVIGNIVDEIWTSKEEKMGHEEFMAKLAQQPGMVQLEINRLEAQHRSIFVAGWRPFIGWVCGIGFLWAFLGQPVFGWITLLMGEDLVPPNIPTENMLELVLALLGLGGLRTLGLTLRLVEAGVECLHLRGVRHVEFLNIDPVGKLEILLAELPSARIT